MRVLTNNLTLPRWQKITDSKSAPLPATSGPTDNFPGQGLPCSVLPAAVQDKLRQGEPVSPSECVPVPSGVPAYRGPGC